MELVRIETKQIQRENLRRGPYTRLAEKDVVLAGFDTGFLNDCLNS